MPVFAINKTLAAIQLLAQSGTQENADAVAGLIGVGLASVNTIVEHTTKKGSVLRGVVRTDLSYAEAKAIDEYTFKKDGGWFIREKHLVGTQAQEQGPIAKQDEPLPVSVKSDALVSDTDNGIDTLELKYKPASKKYKNPEIEMSPKEGAKLLKQTLTKLFPDTKFSVVMSRGTGYGSADVSWVDGASYELVDVIVRHFKGKGFDGSDDSSYYLNSINSEGKVISYGLGYIGTSRGYTKSFLEKLKATLPEHFQKQMDIEGVTIKGVGDGSYFDANEHWTQDTLRKAMSSTSTGHYGFVKIKAKEPDIAPSVEPTTNQMPNLMQDAVGLDPAIKDMVKEYYELVHSTYIDGKLADPTLENWERKEYLSVKADHEKRRIELETHLNETILNTLGIDWIAYYKQLSPTNEAPPTYTPKGENNVSSSSNTLESNSNTGSRPNTQSSVENSNVNGSGESGRMARPSIDGLDAGGRLQRDSGVSVPKNDGASVGTASDSIVSNGSGQRGTGKRDNASDGSGGNSIDEPRSPIVAKRDTAIIRATARDTSPNDLKLNAQLEAEGVATKWGDADNINKALPYLLPEQRDDVVKAEKHLLDGNKNGMLFTNGTGTGKTFTGLGIAKRFANAGKKNILIVSMNDKIIRDFVKSAKTLNLDVHQLDGINDNGGANIVATTYANFGQNIKLGLRDWDLIIVDEAHNLMQGEKGENTEALRTLHALSGHHAGFNDWAEMRYNDKSPKPISKDADGRNVYDGDELAEWAKFKEPLRKEWEQTWSLQPAGRTKVIFLSATPFSYVKTLEWGEGYLFDFVPPKEKYSNKSETEGMAYNSGDNREKFYMSNFGYKMRTNRLTRPDGRVDVGILERKFAEKLKSEGAMSGRDLSVPFDYDRKFVMIDSDLGKKIDEGFKFLWSEKDKEGKHKYGDLLRDLMRSFDYLSRIQLLEAIKADAAIDQIKKHIALGRKVVVFHDYNVGGGSNPFVLRSNADEPSKAQYEKFAKERPDLIDLNLDLDAPVTALKRAFPKAMLFNGTVSKGQRSKNADLFNSDDGAFNLLIAQSDAAATGISLHDTTGKFQRVIINIGMPAKPAKLRQTEGRIYRVGQASNAIQRYLTTGTDWERSAFAQKIAERAETVDNLAQGESATVSIKDALVRAYESAEHFDPSPDDGIGGKAYDAENSRINALSPFDRAKTDYWVKQKVTAKRGDREGKEWYATPEPVGLMMVKLAGAHSGDDILEPSAGDGAIGRYMPSDASVTFIEPSESLASRARMNNTNANVIVDGFESHGSNNKYDAIVMNPPFGNGGAIAIKHLVKSFEHLREGGRVVALLPTGQMDKLVEKYKSDGYFKDIYQVADIALPSCTFENAGTKVNTRIYVFEKHTFKSDTSSSMLKMDLSGIEHIGELFDRIEDINIQPRKPRVDEALAEYGLEIYPDRSKYIITGEGLKRKDITSTLFGSYIEKNKDGDVVDKYNRSIAYLKWLKDSQIPTMAQFNNGLSFNNLPIKYQQKTNKYNTWDGVGSMPDWLKGFISYNGAKLEDFSVEKPQYDSLNGNTSLMDTLALITSLSKKKDDAVAQQLADAIGVKIKKPSPTDFNLSTYTESDLRAQEAVLKAAEVKRQANEKAAKDKAIADKQVGDFRLSGSSLPSDVAASYGQNDMFVQTRGQQVEKPVTDNTKDQPKPKKKIRTYGFNRFLMSQNLTNEELEILAEITRLKHRTNKNGFYLYDKRGVKKLDDLSWVVTWRMKNNDEAKFGKMLDTEDIMRIRDEVRKDYEIGLFDDKDSPQYDDIGGFTFTPAIALNSTLDAIMALAKNNSQANADKLAKLLGVKLAPKQELDMFGEPIQHQELDMFGDPIQDGEDSPVEDLPRLAVVELPLSKLTLSEDVPQFKSGADDESGVVEALGGKFDRTGVAPIQVWERTDGRLEIISGRHRTDLARRSGEKTIPAQVHKESEGFTAKQAMMLDAELNIRDGQGKVKDYVDYFTHSEISEDEADKRGLLARSIGQRAFTIASKGSDELKTLHRNEIISDQAAADIATLAPNNSAMQAVGLRVLQESKPLNNALNTMRAVMALTREKGQEPDTFDLFGFDDSALKEAEAMAKIASRKQRQINEQLTAIKGAVKNPKAAAKHGVIVENQADALEKVKTMTTLKSRWDNWSSHADLLAEVRQEIAEKGGYDSVMSDDDWLLDSLNSDGWIGVDLDSTLAYLDEWQGIENIGEPIPAMVDRVIKWLDQGKDVRIFTARADNAEAIPYIDAWCMKHLGKVLPVTNVKDMSMIELWDDRAIKVEKNTGQVDGYDSLSMPSLTDYDVVDVDTDEIKLNPTAYQWRNNVTGDGTEKGLVVSGAFNYDDQPPLILHRRLSGRVYLADGHHRFKMAKASHAPVVKAIVLDEHDGYTVPAMRVLCGFLNLRKEALVKDRVNLPMVNMAKTADLVRKAVETEMGW